MRIWDVAFEVEFKTNKGDQWDKVDSFTVVAETIEEAIRKCKEKATEEWDKRSVRVWKAELSSEVDVE